MFPHPSTIKREQNIFPLRMSLIENIKNRRPNIDISYLSCMLHLSVTDAVEPDPVDFFHSPSENLGSPVTGKMFNDLQIQEMRMMDKGSRFILSFSFSKQFFFWYFAHIYSTLTLVFTSVLGQLKDPLWLLQYPSTELLGKRSY